MESSHKLFISVAILDQVVPQTSVCSQMAVRCKKQERVKPHRKLRKTKFEPKEHFQITKDSGKARKTGTNPKNKNQEKSRNKQTE